MSGDRVVVVRDAGPVGSGRHPFNVFARGALGTMMTEAPRVDQGRRPPVHEEIFQGTTHEGEIRVTCVCPLGVDHTYSDGLKYLGSVDLRGRR